MINESGFEGVDAFYREAVTPAHRGNILIEALPAPLTIDGASQLFSAVPHFQESDRTLSIPERIQRVLGLSSFSVPIEAQCETALRLDAMIREGYVGRSPRTGEQWRIAQQIYEASVRGESLGDTDNGGPPMLQAILVGVPGTGKTQTCRRVLGRFPKVIRHGDGRYQVTSLEAQVPANGASISGTLKSLIRQLDSLVPCSGYYEQFALKSRPNDTTLLENVAYLANLHHVGAVVLDEIQNLTKSVKGSEVTVAHMVAVLNKARIPVIGIGTNPAYALLQQDARIARRAVTVPIPHWDRLPESVDGRAMNEWLIFMQALWRCQWLKNATPLDQWVLRLFYERCQGILAMAIALFMACQIQAIINGSERITPELICNVFDRQFVPAHGFIEALASGDSQQIANFSDIKPLSLVTEGEPLRHAFGLSGASDAHSARTKTPTPPESPTTDIPRSSAPDVSIVSDEKRSSKRREKRQEPEPAAPLDPADYRSALADGANKVQAAAEIAKRARDIPVEGLLTTF